jgi:hypothetical protein
MNRFRLSITHFAASTLTGSGLEDNIIGLVTGHKSRELRRYQHLREELKRKTVELIASAAGGGQTERGAFSSRWPKKPAEMSLSD